MLINQTRIYFVANNQGTPTDTPICKRYFKLMQARVQQAWHLYQYLVIKIRHIRHKQISLTYVCTYINIHVYFLHSYLLMTEIIYLFWTCLNWLLSLWCSNMHVPKKEEFPEVDKLYINTPNLTDACFSSVCFTFFFIFIHSANTSVRLNPTKEDNLSNLAKHLPNNMLPFLKESKSNRSAKVSPQVWFVLWPANLSIRIWQEN